MTSLKSHGAEALSEPPFDCPVCQSRLSARLVARELTPQGAEVAVRRCPTCGLHFTWPRLSEPQGAYIATTVEAWDTKYGSIDHGERLHDRHTNYLQEVSIVERYLPEGVILDVGCNAGWLLGYLQNNGRHELEGVEPGKVLAQIARRRLGVPIHNCYLHELDGRDGAFDGLVATDVIEHILPEDLNTFLENVVRLLKPGGYAFIKTPNARFTALKSRVAGRLPAFVRRHMLMAEDMWDAKEHVVHWDTANLVRVFGRYGLKPVKVFAPLPVETRGSPMGALLARKALYVMVRMLGGEHRVPFLAQDIFLVARKES